MGQESYLKLVASSRGVLRRLKMAIILNDVGYTIKLVTSEELGEKSRRVIESIRDGMVFTFPYTVAPTVERVMMCFVIVVLADDDNKLIAVRRPETVGQLVGLDYQIDIHDPYATYTDNGSTILNQR